MNCLLQIFRINMLLLVGFLLWTKKLWGHQLDPQLLDTWWFAWNLDFWIIGQLVLVCYLYQRGVAKLRQRMIRGQILSNWQLYCFWFGIGILVLALLSPLDQISQELAHIHMIQHLLIMMIAAPLLVLGAPVMVIVCGLSNPWRRQFWRSYQYMEKSPWPWHWLWQAGFIWLIHALILWLWHIPWLYVAALRFDLVHYFQHLNFFGSTAKYVGERICI